MLLARSRRHRSNAISSANIQILFLPDADDILDLDGFHFRQRKIVFRAVTNDAGQARGRAIFVDARRRRKIGGCMRSDARQIVIKNVNACVVRVSDTTDTLISRAEIAIANVLRRKAAAVIDHLAAPWTILPVGGDDDPFLAKRMPTLFPN